MMDYLDANVFVYAALDSGAQGKAARRVLMECARQERSGVSSILTLDEVVWAVRRAEDHAAGVEAGRRMMALPGIRWSGVTAATGRTALEIMAEHGLHPRDAFHAAAAQEAGCRRVVSTDPDFDALPGLEREAL